MLGQCRIGMTAKENHFAITQIGHLNHLWVSRVEHRKAIIQHHINLCSQYLVNIVIIMHVKLTKPVGTADIHDYAYRAAVIRQTFTQYADRVGFKHSRIDRAINQQALTSVKTRRTSGVYAAATQIQSVGTCQPGVTTGKVQQPVHQSRNLCRSDSTTDTDQRNPSAHLVGKQVIDDGGTNRLRGATRRLQMHQQTRPRIDFHHRTTLLGQWP